MISLKDPVTIHFKETDEKDRVFSRIEQAFQAIQQKYFEHQLSELDQQEDLLNKHQHSDYLEQKKVIETQLEVIKHSLDRELAHRIETIERNHAFTLEKLKEIQKNKKRSLKRNMLSELFAEKRKLCTERSSSTKEFLMDPVFKRFKRFHELREWSDVTEYGFPSATVDGLGQDEICEDMISLLAPSSGKEIFDVDSPEWETCALPQVNTYLTPESSPPKSLITLPSIKDLELPSLIQDIPLASLQDKDSDIYVKDRVLYCNSLSFQKDDRMFLFDSGIKYSVRLLHVGREDLTFQRTDGSKTNVSLALLKEGRVKLLPK